MKKLLMVMAGMTALCLYSSDLEEARQTVREAVEEAVQPNTLEHKERWRQMLPALKALDNDTRLSLYCEMLSEKFHDPNPGYVNHIMLCLYWDDGRSNKASHGNQEALGWMRRVLREKNRRFNIRMASRYLALKGDAQDLDLLDPYDRGILELRAAGTNLVIHPCFDPPGDPIEPNWFHFFPSVTNTGPQALYAEVILRQYWEQMEEEDFSGQRPQRERDRRKIPPELTTLVVWFDGDGEPMCNVDLEKYGLAMPVIEPKPAASDGKDMRRTVTFPRGASPKEPGAEKTGAAAPPPGRFWIYPAVLLTALLAVLRAVRKKRKRGSGG